MARLYLIRHAEAAASWDQDPDPALSDKGRAQAEQVAGSLLEQVLSDTPILSSPMKRCQETAQAYAARVGLPVQIEPKVTEIPSPYSALDKRMVWLREAMAGSWTDLVNAAPGDNPCRPWYDDLLACLINCRQDSVIFTHFVAINAAVAAAKGKAEVLVFTPDHVSVTIIETDGQALHVITTGQAAPTRVI